MNWLVNTSGQPGRFKELDLLQEHENFYIKVCVCVCVSFASSTFAESRSCLIYIIDNLPGPGS